MHVVATNIILWIRTLIKESLEEIEEYKPDKEVISPEMHQKENNDHETHQNVEIAENSTHCDLIFHRMTLMEKG